MACLKFAWMQNKFKANLYNLARPCLKIKKKNLRGLGIQLTNRTLAQHAWDHVFNPRITPKYNNVYNCIQCIKFLVVSNRTHSVSFPYVNILSSPYFSELKHPFEAKPCDFPGTSAFSLSVMFRYQDHGCKDRSYIKGKMR